MFKSDTFCSRLLVLLLLSLLLSNLKFIVKDWANGLVRKYFLFSYENVSLISSTHLKKKTLLPVQVGTCMCAIFNLSVGETETEDPGEESVG